MHAMKRLLWVAIGAGVLFCWMVLGVLVLAVVNYFGVGIDPKRLGETPVRIAYVELAALTFAWPLVLLLATARARMLNLAVRRMLAVMGAVSLVAGGWNVAGHPFSSPQERVMSGLLILAAVAVGWWAAHRFGRQPVRAEAGK